MAAVSCLRENMYSGDALHRLVRGSLQERHHHFEGMSIKRSGEAAQLLFLEFENVRIISNEKDY